MGALSKIRAAGFVVTLLDDHIQISPANKLTPTQRDFLKQHKAQIINELKSEILSTADRNKIVDWLCKIEETDQEIIEGVITQCTIDPKARNYFLQRADGIARPH